MSKSTKISIAVLLLFLISSKMFASTNYVSKTDAHVSPFDSWANAATNIQAAVGAASDDDIVLVNDGTYYPGNQISVTKQITIKSVAGAKNTIINGGYPIQTNRCIYLFDSNPIIDGFTIINGYSSGDGGGVICNRSVVMNSTISGNLSSNFAGGVYCGKDSMVQNCTISNNFAGWHAGGIFCYQGTIQNCTITMNSAGYSGGGVYCSNRGTVENCILWDNEKGNYFENGTTNSHNYTLQPKFIDAMSGNYRLESFSPCIDAGTNMSWMWEATDLDGNPRITDEIVDIGAYEYVPEPVSIYYLLFIFCNLLMIMRKK